VAYFFGASVYIVSIVQH